eukprot:g16197.t1
MGQCCVTFCTPPACVGGCVFSAVFQCNAARLVGGATQNDVLRNDRSVALLSPTELSRRITKFYKLGIAAGFLLAGLGFGLLLVLNNACSGHATKFNFSGGGRCWSEAEGANIFLGLAVAAALGGGAGLSLGLTLFCVLRGWTRRDSRMHEPSQQGVEPLSLPPGAVLVPYALYPAAPQQMREMPPAGEDEDRNSQRMKVEFT